MDEDKLLTSLMQVFIAQMDSALKISKIISEHSNEEELSPDSLITGLIYRLMVSMNDEELKESMKAAEDLFNESESESESESDEEEPDQLIDFHKENRTIKKNTCNCNICSRARVCIANYPNYEVTDTLAGKFKDAIDKTCSIHKLDIV